MSKATPYQVRFGPSTAIFERAGSSVAIVAEVLGREVRDGHELVYLDRLIHDPSTSVTGWDCHGAITTILASALVQNGR